jgi:hypothetical protein
LFVAYTQGVETRGTQPEDETMDTERYFADATAAQLTAAAIACRAVAADADRDAPEAAEARRLTDALGWSWDFSTWSHAASILEREAALAAEKVYVVRDASGEYLSGKHEGERTPASDEAKQFGTREEAGAACERATDRVVEWDAD